MQRLRYLDSLRGIAALYVGLYHTPLVYDPALSLVPEWLKPFHGFGGSGVTLFFVISAFSLCLTMPRHNASDYPTVHYLISRVFRIVPLFYFVLLVYCGIHFLVLKTPVPGDFLFENVALIFNFVPDHQLGIVMASWTIGVEVVFYSLFPILYFAGSTIWRKLALLAGSVVLFLLVPRILALVMSDPAQLSQYASNWFPRFLPIFMVGMVTFDVVKRIENRPYRQAIGAAFLALGFLGIALSMYRKIPWTSLDPTHVWAVAYMFLLTGIALFPWRLIVNPITVFYGKISYSFYLLHLLVIVWVLAPVHQSIAHSGLPHTLSYALCVAATIAGVTPFAALTYYLIEKPGISLGHALLRHLGVRREAIAH